ncbi:hypothetical protein RND71_022880 [Anisodus tanguticus]|uniref:Uncharacterized protein n=1 Tax=Anisodus tanguticus TaxID=243964 RepID=A0AAE1RTD0_9SOLA|nr:hypothetical protein RND71_022880 [Anisodus tanguticus]
MAEEGSAATRVYLQEDMDDKWLTNDDSLSGSLGNKGGIGVLSQLELLTDVKRLHHSTHTMNSHQLRQTDLCKEDDVEFPFFKSQDGDFINKNDHWMALSLDDEFCHITRMTSTCNSEEEIISDDEMRPSTDGILKRDGKNTMPKVSGDCKSGVFLNKDAGCSSLYGASSKLNRSSKGISISDFIPLFCILCLDTKDAVNSTDENNDLNQSLFVTVGSHDKAKPKFLFQSRPQKKDFALVVHDTCETSTPLSVLPLNVELDMQRENLDSLDDLMENSGGNEIQQFEENLVSSDVAVAPDPNGHSMAEFLDHFQHTSSLPRGNSKMLQSKRQGSRFLRKSNLLLLGDRNMSNGDQSEALDSDPSSDDGILKSAIPQRTMADQFHLAFRAVSTNERLSIARPKQFGLSGRLQHVMQCEKDRDTYFLEKSQIHDASSGAESFIDVRILSSSLEAKLTVCFCALHGDEEGSESLNNPKKRRVTGGRKLTIIFSSRVCKDVELEIGNVIRIHQPWKEVHVDEKDEAIILCAYFSQI